MRVCDLCGKEEAKIGVSLDGEIKFVCEKCYENLYWKNLN